MGTLTSGNTQVLVDEEGFLSNIENWDEEIAQTLAEHEGITQLSEEKLKIVRFMRDYYFKNHNFPILGNVCRKIGHKSKNCVKEEFINPMKAWKIAGLPKPPNIFFTTFDNKKYSANPFY